VRFSAIAGAQHRQIRRCRGQDRGKRLARAERVPLPVPTRRGERWSMDFTLDPLAYGRAFRTLNILDDFTTSASRSRWMDPCPPCA
jgi:hypothetical protein